jgi:hypothetical protein
MKDAKLHIEGLGGSYGIERLTYYKMLPEMGGVEELHFAGCLLFLVRNFLDSWCSEVMNFLWVSNGP